MKVRIKYKVSTQTEVISLMDYGYDEETKWSELTEDQQHEIEDSLREQNVILVEVEDVNE